MKNKITYPFRWICNPPAVNYFGDPSLAVIPNEYVGL